MARNKFVLAIRPDPSDVNTYLDDGGNDYRIVYGKTLDGDVIAKTTLNGHTFLATHANHGRATRMLTEKVEQAELDGDVQHPKTYPALTE